MPIRTIEFDWLLGNSGEVRNITCALARQSCDQWILVRTSPPIDEHEPPEWCNIAVGWPENEPRSPSASGNHTIALKNYSEAEGLLARLESKGIVRHTGKRIPQGFVMLEIVEILIPDDELIRGCSNEQCENGWEEVNKARFQKCSKCKLKFYCSRDCQTKDWKAGHKKYCREGMTENEVADKAKADIARYLQESGFSTMTS
jgi:hypothetical protein